METSFEMLGRPLSLLTNNDKHFRSAEAQTLFVVKEWEEKQGWAVTQTKTHARVPTLQTQVIHKCDMPISE